MVDIVTLFKDRAESLNFTFDYGTKAMTNLLRSNMVTSEIYFLLGSPLNWKREASSFGLGRSYVEGSFILVVKSKLDNVTYRQKNQNEDDGKYLKNVKPLLDKLEEFESLMLCVGDNFEVVNAIDGYNLLDANTDGLIVDFKYTAV